MCMAINLQLSEFGTNAIEIMLESNDPSIGIMFQLIASQIIDIQFDTIENEVLLGLGEANGTTTELAMTVDTFWYTVQTFT